MSERLAIDLQRVATQATAVIYSLPVAFGALGHFVNPWFHIGTGLSLIPVAMNVKYKYIQKKHTLLRNFGILGTARYMMESVGPELRQYFFANDTEERPFNRVERAEVYQKAKGIDSTTAFGSLKEYDNSEVKLRHSFFPIHEEELEPYKVTFGEERKLKNKFTINKPFMISAMSYGALGEHAVRSLSRGAKMAGIPQNTGEGGYPKYHLMEGANLIFQMGTAKFGVRNDDFSLNDKKLKELANHPNVKMIEIKFSQGAKPGKGGLLPKEKITKEIAELRHVKMGEDVVSPPRHIECDSPKNTVKFIQRVQDVSKLPVGIKFCLGDPNEFKSLVKEMKRQRVYPDYIAVDGGEGGTGAAPKSFIDGVGMPGMVALHTVNEILKKERIRNKLKLVSSGKLLNTRKQMVAFSHGADAIYIARGFMFAIGCIQALQCNKNICPVGITTHDKKLQRGIVIADKAKRVKNYVDAMFHEFEELMMSMGVKNYKQITHKHLYEPSHEAKEYGKI